MQVTSVNGDSEKVLRGIVGAFFVNAAQRQPDGSYVTISNNHTCHIHPSSVLFGRKPACVVFDELMLTQKSYMHGVSVVQPEWLAEMAPRFYRNSATAVGPQNGNAANATGVASRLRGAQR